MAAQRTFCRHPLAHPSCCRGCCVAPGQAAQLAGEAPPRRLTLHHLPGLQRATAACTAAWAWMESACCSEWGRCCATSATTTGAPRLCRLPACLHNGLRGAACASGPPTPRLIAAPAAWLGCACACSPATMLHAPDVLAAVRSPHPRLPSCATVPPRSGVIVGWDPECRASEEWMQQMGVDRLPGALSF